MYCIKAFKITSNVLFFYLLLWCLIPLKSFDMLCTTEILLYVNLNTSLSDLMYLVILMQYLQLSHLGCTKLLFVFIHLVLLENQMLSTYELYSRKIWTDVHLRMWRSPSIHHSKAIKSHMWIWWTLLNILCIEILKCMRNRVTVNSDGPQALWYVIKCW